MTEKKKKIKTLKFTISNGGGDGAYLCYTEVTKEIYDYFEENNLDLYEYALDSDYAETNNIPEDMQPFEPGARAEFGYYECCMSANEGMTLTVEDEDFDEIYCGSLPKSNLKEDKKSSESLKNFKKGIYAAGYEGLEDCYIEGEIEIDSEFDVKKLIVKYGHLDYEVGERDWISSISYDNQDVPWYIGSYEGTGDNSFEFVKVE